MMCPFCVIYPPAEATEQFGGLELCRNCYAIAVNAELREEENEETIMKRLDQDDS